MNCLNHHSRIARCLLLSALVVVAGCTTLPTQDDTRRLLADRFQSAYIEPYVAGETERWLRVFAPNAVALHDGLPPLEGEQGIRGFAEAVSANFHIRRLDASIDEIRINGSWAWTRGRFTAEFEAKSAEAPPGVAGERAGKFLLIWEKGSDDVWRVVMDMGNSLPLPGKS